MTHRALLAFASLALLAGCFGGPDPDAAPANPYTPLVDSPIRGLTPEQILALEEGSGMSLALPAELNGYPGPKHVLDLADELGLTTDQVDEVEVVRSEMEEAAQDLGAQILELYKELDDGFRNETLEETDVEALVSAIAALEGELRYTHLRAHMETRPILTEHQQALYMQLRGYGEADHGAHEH